ncbi:hypothetical protein [Dactylosporangium sp. CA-233914]|uniref:hypothetical protein n=1 Tax=Dactylosporangium sp. CA-233914 TaxID=3239934 RepID=UPI003D8C4E96
MMLLAHRPGWHLSISGPAMSRWDDRVLDASGPGRVCVVHRAVVELAEPQRQVRLAEQVVFDPDVAVPG